MKSDLIRIVNEFATAPMAAGKAMRQMLSEWDPEAFLDAAIPLLRTSPDKPGVQYLLTLLLINDLILNPLIDPVIFSFDQAIAIAKQLVKIEPLLDIRMMRRLVESRTSSGDLAKSMDNTRGIRLLEVMAAISDGARILPVMSQLLHHSNPKIRSKAALLVGRSNKNCKWVEQRLGESDSRVRANAVESLLGVDSPEAKNVFWAAVSDADNRVAGNALMGLYRLGEVASIPLIVDMASDIRADFRVTAAWAMGETGDPRFLSVLARMISDPDTQVRALVFRSIAKLKQVAAKYPSEANLMIHLTPGPAVTGLWSEIVVGIWEHNFEGVQPLAGIRPTQFVLYEDSRLVTQYEIQENYPTEGLSIAWAIPRIPDRDHPFHARCDAAFEAALQHKRKCDAWLVLKYLSETGRVMPAAPRSAKRIFQIQHVEASTTPEASIPVDARFHTDPEAILDALELPGNRMLLPHSPVKAIEALVTPLSYARGSRHVVLVYHSEMPEPEWEHWQEVAQPALSSRVAVHIIAFGPQPELLQLSARTGGTFTLLASPEGFQAALEGLCATLIHSYSIRYRAADRDETTLASLKLRVYREGGFGEGTLHPGEHVVRNAEVA